MSQSVISFFRKLLDLREGAEDKQVIIENIKDDSDFSSARFWTLVFAVGVASVGLNINSIPVVIGAMLISPIMGPVVSIGLSLAINDWGLMRRSFRNLIILVVITITISTIYFALTPIVNAQSELLSRIRPTIFDVLIAVFGGIAGFIGISRAKHSNIIAGFAIATALMPPLCTVGYGLGTLQLKFVLGASYLFLINCIFICLSALLVSKYLKLPRVHYDNVDHQRKVRRIITAIIVVVTVPAIYFAYTFVKENNFRLNAEQFVQTTFVNNGYVIIYQNISYESTPHNIELAFLSKRFTKDEVQAFESQLPLYGLPDTTLYIRQDNFTLTEEEWQDVLREVNGDNAKVFALETRLKNEQLAFSSPERLLEEIRIIDKRITNIAIGSLTYATTTDPVTDGAIVALVQTDTNAPAFTTVGVLEFTQWLKVRIDNPNVTVFFTPPPVSNLNAATESN